MSLSKSASETFGPIYYRDSSVNSDKIYQAQLNWDGINYIVTFMWGRRGTSLQRSRKTFRTEAAARAAIEDKLYAKRREGYSDSPDDRAAKVKVGIDLAEKKPPKLEPSFQNLAPDGTLKATLTAEEWAKVAEMRDEWQGRRPRARPDRSPPRRRPTDDAIDAIDAAALASSMARKPKKKPESRVEPPKKPAVVLKATRRLKLRD